ncbi:YicC/YloC family endoribonuclease [Methylovirgula sp. 4M-Z18]|uniref:YicC/YloC family endoribonuclease n=1 Tax=Methylovirgula sp. 4M-Z18 TaxID=2293567 RepID=UPI001FE19396|nr:YicC/YloC family endoribonuclease [Methylovirgula sp. 4M-Z18]
MTGFARISGHVGNWTWAWELKTVNAKGLDLRLRMPTGFDAIDGDVRARLAKSVARGSCYATLSAQREAPSPTVRVNTDVLAKLIEILHPIALQRGLEGPSLDGLLAIRGVVEMNEDAPAEAETEVSQAILAGLDRAAGDLAQMRRREGEALSQILQHRLDRIALLTNKAEHAPARAPEAVKARLVASVAALIDTNSALDVNRLHQEAMLLAAKADIREELDRLKTHVQASRDLLIAGGPIGRRLDFLAQEFGREANTLCSKANDVSLTAIGLDLKAEIEQFREQIQNIE